MSMLEQSSAPGIFKLIACNLLLATSYLQLYHDILIYLQNGGKDKAITI